MSDKLSPDEVLAYWSKQAIFGHGSPQAELRDALHDAIAQRDDHRGSIRSFQAALREAQAQLAEARAQLAEVTRERDELAHSAQALTRALGDRVEERDEARRELAGVRQALLECADAIEQPEIQDPRARKGTWTPTPAYMALKNAGRQAREALQNRKES